MREHFLSLSLLLLLLVSGAIYGDPVAAVSIAQPDRGLPAHHSAYRETLLLRQLSPPRAPAPERENSLPERAFEELLRFAKRYRT